MGEKDASQRCYVILMSVNFYPISQLGNTSSMTRDWKPGDLIFAKMKGYPHWPARVSKGLDQGQTQIRKIMCK